MKRRLDERSDITLRKRRMRSVAEGKYFSNLELLSWQQGRKSYLICP
jgi:hypothetical protein